MVSAIVLRAVSFSTFPSALKLYAIILTALFQTVINYGPISISFKFEVYTYTVLGTYFISFFVFAVLYYLNKRMYKLTAYRISLNKRHKFHNLPHLIICLRLLLINLKNNKDSKIKNVMVVKNAMGEALPKTYKANEYFKDLQQQWK
uniref:Uncharacterized protein n=1 Tax=Panagrolaimus davidi TaxID=227884 RepID=A0A914PA96_9BILA